MKISSSSSDNSIASSSKRFLDDKLDNSDEDDKSGIVLSEQESSAAECLLGLAVGQRKSSRVKKKPSQLTGYEIEQQKDDSSGTTSLPDGVMVSVSGVSEAGEGNAPTSVVVPQLTTPNQMQNFLANLGLPGYSFWRCAKIYLKLLDLCQIQCSLLDVCQLFLELSKIGQYLELILNLCQRMLC